MDPTSKDPNAPATRRSMPELLENYEAEYARLVAQSRELARLRERVLDSAEREAAAIMADARHEVRRVLVNARRELVVLAAQLQAVGCNAPDLPVVSSQTGDGALPVPAGDEPPADSHALAISRAVLGEGRRSIREVLLEARAELQAFSEEARELRDRLAHEPAAGHQTEPHGARSLPAPEPSAPALSGRHDTQGDARDKSVPLIAVPSAPASVAPPHPAADDEARTATGVWARETAAAPERTTGPLDDVVDPEPSDGSSLPEFPSEAAGTATPAAPAEPRWRAPAEDWMAPPPAASRRGDLPPRGLFSSDAPDAARSRRRAILAAVAVLCVLALLGLGVSRAIDRYDAAADVEAGAAAAPASSGDSPEVSTSAPPAAPSPAPTGTRGTPGAPLSIRMEVIRPSWIRTTLDGRPDAGRLYRAGETWTVSATDSVLLRAGDAGAVRVSVNGAAAEPLGADGQVVTRRFTRPGAERPAAATDAPDGGAPSAALPAPAPSPVREAAPLPAPSAGPSPSAGTSPAPVDPAPARPAAAEGAAAAGPNTESGPLAAPAADAASAALPRTADAPATPAVLATEAPRPLNREPAAEQEIHRLTQQWFNAYFAGERAPAGADQPAVVDLRPPASRAADRSRSAAERVLKAVHVEVAGTGGVLSGRVESAPGPDGPARVTLVSAVWTFQNGRWSLVAARLAEPAAAAAARP